MSTTDAAENRRIERDVRRSNAFRAEFVAGTPGWYHGGLHLGFTLLVTLGTIAWCWSHLDRPTAWEWLAVIPIVFFGNWAEWAGHRYVLHRPVPGLKMIYKRHCGVHHRFFTDHTLAYRGHKEWRALLFPPFAPVAFILASVPPALLVGALWSANAAYIVVLTMAAYYLMYEGLHTLSHLDDERHPYLRHVPLVNTVRRMHRVHHHLGFMQTRNFNLTFPICDALFGTSDVDRGVIGTLFSGAGERWVRRDLHPEPPPAEFYGAEDAAGGDAARRRPA
ncbi:sterol desaturase family protein [Azospirillum sp. ST 5-10]|uniref:sterol desaturase family protein n=1 Tax=unclassified Azospirillum TaxID=2630922 RepID=UPI003F49EFA0